MNTRRCPRCQTQRPEDEQVCSRCGYAFSGSTWEPEWEPDEENLTTSSVSLPSASPHIAGHYSGLHPEDQPYLSKSMRVRGPEPDRATLARRPTEEPAAIQNISSSKEEDFYEQKAQRSLFSPKSVNLNAWRSHIAQQPHQVSQQKSAPAEPQKKQRFLPWRIPFFAHKKSTILTLICIVSLLMASIVAFLLLGKHDSDAIAMKATSTATHSRQPSTSPTLQLVQKDCDFAGAAPGVVSSQNVMLLNNGGSSVSWQSSSNSAWLQLSPRSGTFTSSENVRVTVNRGKLAPRAYTGLITFTQRNKQPSPAVMVAVHMSVTSSGPLLSLSTTNLTYATVFQQDPASQVITLANSVPYPQNWTASVETDDDGSWLSPSALSGLVEPGTSQAVSVNVLASSLALGTYHGTITFHGDVSAQIGVVLTVTAPAIIAQGQLSLSSSTLAFTTPAASNPATQQLTLTNTGAASLDWSLSSTTSDGTPWLAATPQGGTLAVQEQDVVTVSIDATSLQVGTYQGTLTFTSQTNTVSVSLTLTVTPPPTPVISTQTTGLTFSTSEDATTDPAAQNITITNTGNAPLHWLAMTDQDALIEVAPTQGVLNAGQSVTLAVTMPITSEEPGVQANTYTDTITFSDSTLPSVAQKTVNVSVTVLPASDSSGGSSNATASPAAQ